MVFRFAYPFLCSYTVQHAVLELQLEFFSLVISADKIYLKILFLELILKDNMKLCLYFFFSVINQLLRLFELDTTATLSYHV